MLRERAAFARESKHPYIAMSPEFRRHLSPGRTSSDRKWNVNWQLTTDN